MRGLGSNSDADQASDPTPNNRRSRLTLDGLACARERHSFTGQRHGFAVDIFTFTRAGKRDWSLMVVKEYWWIGEESKDTKVLRWAGPTGGRRNDIIAWFREQEAILERSSAPITEIGTRSQVSERHFNRSIGAKGRGRGT